MGSNKNKIIATLFHVREWKNTSQIYACSQNSSEIPKRNFSENSEGKKMTSIKEKLYIISNPFSTLNEWVPHLVFSSSITFSIKSNSKLDGIEHFY